MVRRRSVLRSGALTMMVPVAAATAHASDATMRVPLETPETGFDPAFVTDAATNLILYHLYDTPVRYRPLARGLELEPGVLTSLPAPAADFRTWTLEFRRGIFFEDHPAFSGRPRELVAADLAYSIRRHFDPASVGGGFGFFSDNPPTGLTALRQRASRDRRPFDYDAPASGVQLIDRFTLRIAFERPMPRFDHMLTLPVFFIVAREVVERFGRSFNDHPVGTGAYRLAAWQRSARVVLERRPAYREDRIAPPQVPLDADVATRLVGRQLPLAQRIEFNVVLEDQSRWLAFQRGDLDVLVVPPGFGTLAAPGGKLAPYLARRGVRIGSTPTAVLFYLSFNMEDPLVGGYEPETTALRRAIGLAFDARDYIDTVLNGAGVPAQSPIAPISFGFDAALASEMGAYDPTRARALLDVYGYLDRNGDGWRERPDGRPLVLEMLVPTGQRSRAINEQWRRYLTAIGLRIAFRTVEFPELLRNARGGKFMLVGGGYSYGADASALLGLAYGGNINSTNRARFRLPAYDRLFERQAQLPDGEERRAAMLEAARLLAAYMPIKCQYHQVASRLGQPWIVGPLARQFGYPIYSYLAVDQSTAQAALR